MRIPYIAANWKMNMIANTGLLPEQEYADAIIATLTGLGDTPAEVSVFCPYTHLTLMGEMSENQFNVGAQNMSGTPCGAYTGDVNADILQDVGIDHVLLGHSECRKYHNETDSQITQKLGVAMNRGMYAVVCIGETDAQNQAGHTYDVLQNQLRVALDNDVSPERLVIAYEPLWAIGTGRLPRTDDISDIHTHIRTFLGDTYGMDFSDTVRIIYGGSVTADNASEILALSDVDGVLVGGASLHSDTFCQILSAVGT